MSNKQTKRILQNRLKKMIVVAVSGMLLSATWALYLTTGSALATETITSNAM